MAEQPDPLVEQIGHGLWKMQRKIVSGMALHQEMGLTFPQFALLNMVGFEGKSRVVQLAEKMEVKPSAITVMLDRLEQMGLITREQDESDRRAVVVSVTDKGQKVREEGQRRSKRLLEQYLSPLTHDELERMAALFAKLDEGER